MALNLERPTRPTSFPLACPKVGNMMVACGYDHTVGLKSDGTCVAVGDNTYGQCNISNWSGIVAIACGTYHTVGLKSDGTCVATGNNDGSQCNVSGWSNIVAIASNGNQTVGLKSDGTCVATGKIDDSLSGWSNIVAIASSDNNYIPLYNIGNRGSDYVVGLKSDGTCLTTRYYAWNETYPHYVGNWSNVVAIASNGGHTVALKSDGTCGATGNNGDSQCNVSGWSDIVAVACGDEHTVGLKSDGTCVAVGRCDVSGWSDIVAIACNFKYAVGLKSDGTCVATGYYYKYGKCNVSGWNLYAYKKALMISLAGLNFTNYNAVNSLSVDGIEPENTKRRLAFKVDNKWNKLAISNGAATLSALPTQTLTADSVLEEGNTAAEVISATSIPDFAGKIVYPAIALYADSKASVMPTLGLKANATTTTEKYTQEGYSQEYHLSDAPVSVVSLKADITAKGAASAVVTVSLKNGDTWGDYIDIEKAIGQKATDIKFKTIYTVTKTDGSESASLNNVTCTYTTSGNKVTNKAADVVTITKEFTNDLVYIHAYVKHKPLKDAKINVYAALRPTPKKRDMKQIGAGNGETQTVKVDDVGINQDTLRLYYDGKAVYDFDYNTETSEITFKAAVGVVVSASYEYGWKAADWLPMTQGLTQNNDSGNDTTEYTYTVPAHKDALTVTAIRYELLRPTGHVSDEVIGIGTGTRQIIKLPHFAKKETIVCSGAWSYDYDSRLVTVVADKGTEIKISYDWIAEQPEVISIGAGWADE